jgi:dolichol-phosphate mannosyltransferase
MVPLSVVVPVYGCSACLRALHARLTEALNGISDDWEILYVDDRGPDDPWQLLVELAGSDRRVRAYRLSQNFGQSGAIRAGLANSEGERVVIMDCDLQDPPEVISRLYSEAEAGAEIVFTARPEPDSYGLMRRLGTAAYMWLRRQGPGRPRPRYSSFSMISRRAVRAVLAASSRNQSYLITLRSLNLPSAAIEVPRNRRYAGQSSYTLAKLLRVGIGNLRSQYRDPTIRDATPPPYEVDLVVGGNGHRAERGRVSRR